MKNYRPTADVAAAIGTLLSSNHPAFNHSPLEQVAELLTSGRHYSWVGIFLASKKHPSSSPLQEAGIHPAQLALHGTVKKIVVSIRIGGRELGFLAVESDRESAFGADDRVLLERVAGLLARFLAGRGKYLALKATRSGPSRKAASA